MFRIPVPDPPLVSDLVRLRPWRHSDADLLLRGWLDPTVAKWNAVPEDATLEHAQRWIGGWGERHRVGLAIDFVICDAAQDDHGVGEVGLAEFDDMHGSAEIGFWLLPEARSRGLATDAVSLVAEWATTRIGVRLLYARTHGDNGDSQGVLDRAGFTAKGHAGDGRLVWKFESESSNDR